jgi:hypothetical protein
MRNKRVILATLLLSSCFMACTTIAPAAIFATATLIKDPSAGVPFGAPDAALGSPWASYRISLQATGGSLIQAADVQIAAPLHQRWTSSNFDGVYDTPTGNSTNVTNGDSHLSATAGALFGAPPTEDNPFVGSPLSATNNDSTGYGVGTHLTGAFAPPGPALTSMNLAYIVIPKGAAMDISIRVADPAGAILGTFTCADLGCGGNVLGVAGNSLGIARGDMTPSLLDSTDFGSALRGSMQQRTFTVTNGSGALASLGTPTLSGPYTIVGSFPHVIPAGGSVSFTVDMNTSAFGSFSGSISIPTSDSLNDYKFSLAGKVVPEPGSIMLALLAAIGLVGFTRRKRHVNSGSGACE